MAKLGCFSFWLMVVMIGAAVAIEVQVRIEDRGNLECIIMLRNQLRGACATPIDKALGVLATFTFDPKIVTCGICRHVHTSMVIMRQCHAGIGGIKPDWGTSSADCLMQWKTFDMFTEIRLSIQSTATGTLAASRGEARSEQDTRSSGRGLSGLP